MVHGLGHTPQQKALQTVSGVRADYDQIVVHRFPYNDVGRDSAKDSARRPIPGRSTQRDRHIFDEILCSLNSAVFPYVECRNDCRVNPLRNGDDREN